MKVIAQPVQDWWLVTIADEHVPFVWHLLRLFNLHLEVFLLHMRPISLGTLVELIVSCHRAASKPIRPDLILGPRFGEPLHIVLRACAEGSPD